MSHAKNILFRRKRKFINTKVQLSIALWLTVNALVFFGLILVILFIPPVSNWFKPGDIDSQVLMTDFFRLLGAKWVLVVIILAIMGIAANFFSHRVVGPEFRFRQVLKSLSEKDLGVRFKLRRLDYHKDLEQSFKKYIDTLKTRVSSMRNHVDELSRSLSEGDGEKAKGLLGNMKKDLDEYKLD